MNFLAHLYLADATGTQPQAALLADIVKGRLEGRFASDLEIGLRLHRHIDSYTDTHGKHLAARRRIAQDLRRYAGILVDVFFDHFLAVDWRRYSEESLQRFSDRMLQSIKPSSKDAAFAAELERALEYVHRHNLLVNYRELDGIQHALRGLSDRLSRPNPLAQGVVEMEGNYAGLRHDFEVFFPELIDFAEQEAERLKTQIAAGG